MAGVRYVPNRANLGEMLRSDFMRAAMEARAQRIKSFAEALAPVGDPATDPHPGLFRSSFHVTSTNRGGPNRDRAEATVTNDAPYAQWVEFGTSRKRGHHTLLAAAKLGGGGD